MPEASEVFIENPYPDRHPIPLVNYARTFHWVTEGIRGESLISQIDGFYQGCSKTFLDSLPPPQETVHLIETAMTLGENIYKLNYPNQETGLPYHNADHATLTTYYSALAFLGYCQQGNKPFDKNVFKLLLTGATLHELGDWWEPTDTVLEYLNNYLTREEISAADLNQILELDSYTKSLDQTVKAALNPRAIIPANEINRCLPTDPEKARPLLLLLGTIIRGADFLQAANPAYTHIVKITLPDKSEREIGAGPLILAQEMANHRPKALEALGWDNGKGSVDWTKPTISVDFLRNLALANINPLLPFLDSFSPAIAGSIKTNLGFTQAVVAAMEN